MATAKRTDATSGAEVENQPSGPVREDSPVDKVYVRASAAVMGLRAFETGWIAKNDEVDALLANGMLEAVDPPAES